MKWWDKLIEHFNRGYEEEDLELEFVEKKKTTLHIH